MLPTVNDAGHWQMLKFLAWKAAKSALSTVGVQGPVESGPHLPRARIPHGAELDVTTEGGWGQAKPTQDCTPPSSRDSKTSQHVSSSLLGP